MVLLLVGIWVLVALLINPRGEFPLNDDWIYAKTVKTLLAGGGLHFADMYANIVAQIFWGALFCLPFGFSFTALRISTLTLGLIGVLALYGVLREAGADRNTALFGALLLAFNPLYMVLSYSFMSDVPFTAVCIVSLYFIMRGFRRNTHFEVAAGLSLACLALLIRQPGLAIFVGFALAYLAKSGWRPRNLFLAGISVMLGGTVQVLWDQWMRYKHILPPPSLGARGVGPIAPFIPLVANSWTAGVRPCRHFCVFGHFPISVSAVCGPKKIGIAIPVAPADLGVARICGAPCL